jgi:hypothetical protein
MRVRRTTLPSRWTPSSYYRCSGYGYTSNGLGGGLTAYPTPEAVASRCRQHETSYVFAGSCAYPLAMGPSGTLRCSP